MPGEVGGSILVLNAGSSSIKFAAFDNLAIAGDMRARLRGHAAWRDAGIELRVEDADGRVVAQSHGAAANGGFDHDTALAMPFGWIDPGSSGASPPAAVGHRVVHGGQAFVRPVAVSDAVLGELEALVPLAPLHQPHNLRPIRAVRARWPGVPQVACFDTAFHGTQPAVAQAFALPREIAQAGVRRHGFHGLSYEHVASRLPQVLGDAAARGRSSSPTSATESADPRAAEAVNLFVYRVVTGIGAMAAAIGGLDALVFTAGIGENATAVRARICAGCAWLGADIDDGANSAGRGLIHRPGSRLPLAVVPTDEERLIARHTARCLASLP